MDDDSVGASLSGVWLQVDGELPPVKNEAKSLLAADHPQRGRVIRLLEAARAAMAGRALLRAPVALELTVWAADGDRLPDATNVLGGVGDVLQRRHEGTDVGHLGDLAGVACFDDDNAIHEVRYRRVLGSRRGYELRVYELGGTSAT